MTPGHPYRILRGPYRIRGPLPPAFAEAPAYAEATAGRSADKSCEGG